jgi:hypothetical protein
MRHDRQGQVDDRDIKGLEKDRRTGQTQKHTLAAREYVFHVEEC